MLRKNRLIRKGMKICEKRRELQKSYSNVQRAGITMRDQWFKLLADGLTCARREPSREDNKRRGGSFTSRLAGAKAAMEALLEANVCPKEKIENFKILGRLGKGGFAQVFMAEYVKDHKIYALKVVKKDDTDDMANIRIVREKKLMRAIQFEFIIEIHYAFQDDRYFYMVMDSALHGSLGLCVRTVYFPEKTVKWYAVQIILAVEYLHECNIMHRDLKPGNMLIFEDGHLKVSDLGFAKRAEWRTNTYCGTPAYMPPEIALHVPYSKWVDWWAVGVTLYEMMYGDLPFYEPAEELLFPEYADTESPLCDLLNQLLVKEHVNRLGYRSDDVKKIWQHKWFEDISLPDVFAKKLNYKPKLRQAQPRALKTYEFLEKPAKPALKSKWYNSFCSE